VREAALAALPQLVEIAMDSVVGQVSPLFAHEDWHVRSAALKALTHVVPQKGDRGAIAAVCKHCLEGPSRAVREGGVDALTHLTDRGDEVLTAWVSDKLCHQDAELRVVAAIVAARFAPKGHVQTLDALAARTHDESGLVRQAAKNAVAELTGAS